MVPLQGGRTWRDFHCLFSGAWGSHDILFFLRNSSAISRSRPRPLLHPCSSSPHACICLLCTAFWWPLPMDLLHISVSMCLYLPAASTNRSLNPLVFNHKAAFLFSSTFLYGNAHFKCLTTLSQVPGHLGPRGDWSLFLEWHFYHWKWGLPAEPDQNLR